MTHRAWLGTVGVMAILSCWTAIVPAASGGIVAIKTGPERIGAAQLSELVHSLGGNPLIVSDPAVLIALLQDPEVECVVIDGWWRHEFEGMGDALLAYFEDGGCLVGFYNSGHSTAGVLSTQVFPANGTLRIVNPGMSLECTVLVPEHEVCQGLNGEFAIKDSELVFHGEKAGRQYVYVNESLPPGSQILVADKAFGAPVIISRERTGRSVYFAGGGITGTSTPAYLNDTNFQSIFGSSLIWVREGRGIDARRGRLEERLEEGRSTLASMNEKIDEIRRTRSTSGLKTRLLLVALAAMGLASGAYLLLKG